LPFVTVNNVRLFYRLEGKQGAPVLVLSHSIGTDHGMWAPQMPDLLQHFQVLRFDTRGHGASDVPAGEYTLEQLGRDVLGLVDSLQITKFAFCGLSMGGAIGQWLALNAPDRLTGLVLANTSPQFGPVTNWDTRRKTVLENGMAAILDMAMQRFFSADSPLRQTNIAAAESVLLGTRQQRCVHSMGGTWRSPSPGDSRSEICAPARGTSIKPGNPAFIHRCLTGVPPASFK
jgi:3-oxoadipate enol-lactonase